MMFFGPLLVLLGLGAVAYLLGWRPQDRSMSGPDREKKALDILNERYARGEITREQYQSIREDLER